MTENKGSYHLYKSLWGFQQVTIGLTVHEYLVTPGYNSHPGPATFVEFDYTSSHYSFNFVFTLICICNFHISLSIMQFFLPITLWVLFSMSQTCANFVENVKVSKGIFSPFLTVSIRSHMSDFTWRFKLPEGHTWKGEQDSQCQSRPCYK